MAEKVLTLYLAGAIRDNRPEDIEWRERVIDALKGLPVRILNPLGGKSYDPATGAWSVSGIPSTAKVIWQHDEWCVEQSDIVLFNFSALQEKYPNIGTLVEFGMAVGKPGKRLIYSVIDATYEGHENKKMYPGLHPFLAQPSSHVFDTMGDAIEFLKRHIKVLTGRAPSFATYREQQAQAIVDRQMTLDEVADKSR